MQIVKAWSDDQGAQRVRAQFEQDFEAQPDGVWAAPGRVNLIGEHVDYNGGLCLPMALPHRTFAAVRRRDDDVVRLTSANAEPHLWQGRLADITGTLAGQWASYAAGPAATLAENGMAITGFDAAIDSCVPFGAGLSSSAAIESVIAVALDQLSGANLAVDDAGRARLAQACVRAENLIAGANTGGMDQATSLRATKGHGLLLDCLDGSVQQVPLDLAAMDAALLVVDTRAEHKLVDGQYAARRADCERAAELLGVQTLREVEPANLDAALAQLPEAVLQARVRHVVTEIERTARFAERIAAGDLAGAGALMVASHVSLRDDYQVSAPELDLVVDTAMGLGAQAGVFGARMTGGGFGGSAIVLVRAEAQDAVLEAITMAFAERQPPLGLVATPAAAARRVN